MAKKFVVIRATHPRVTARTIRWEKTWWTDPDAESPKAVDKETALAALANARRTYPKESYRLREVR